MLKFVLILFASAGEANVTAPNKIKAVFTRSIIITFIFDINSATRIHLTNFHADAGTLSKFLLQASSARLWSAAE